MSRRISDQVTIAKLEAEVEALKREIEELKRAPRG
jgi:hypothetical protein